MAISVGDPGPKVSFLKRRFPASKMMTSNPSDLRLSIIVAFRARPPRGFFFQPQGSVSPCTLAVPTIRICLEATVSAKPI
ncbi:MAG TPA: hypothetical protein QGI69_01590 [Candidatus Marinimicrobia bacterium]|nr:hypothetical protein [Candidatus Neomarinimicrobiota bacterium]